MKKIDMSERAVEGRLRQLGELHALSLELLRVGRNHYRQQEDSVEKRSAMARYRRYLIECDPAEV
jgi:hypothetical protein